MIVRRVGKRSEGGKSAEMPIMAYDKVEIMWCDVAFSMNGLMCGYVDCCRSPWCVLMYVNWIGGTVFAYFLEGVTEYTPLRRVEG